MRERTVICVGDSDASSDICEALRGSGWPCRTTPGGPEDNPKDSALGLLAFPNGGGAIPQAVAKVIHKNHAAGNTRWIARLPLHSNVALPPALMACMSDYLSPPHHPESLMRSIRRALAQTVMERLSDAGIDVPQLLCLPPETAGHLQDMLTRAAQQPQSPVLISGDIGTGKSLLARTIHKTGPLADRPFLTLNCATLPHSIMSATLLGQDGEWPGLLTQAAGGSVYLEMPDDLPVDLQRQLAEQLVHARQPAAQANLPSNMPARLFLGTRPGVEAGPLQAAVEASGQMHRIALPALAGRPDNIQGAAQRYLGWYTQALDMASPGFSPQALRRMSSYEWPGNVSELVGRVHQALDRAENRMVFPSDLELDRRSPARSIKTMAQARAEAERDALMRSLQYAGNNVAEAARALGISRLTVHRLMDKHGVAVTPSLDKLAG